LVHALNGSEPADLTADSEANEFFPSWRPDGRKLALMSNRATPTNPTGDYEIFVMDADGSGLRQLTAKIYTMRPDGSRVRQLTFNELADRYPAWSPAGRWIAFATDRDGNSEIYSMRADGSDQVNLTRHPASDFAPDWQPFPERHH
jgi:Tol biopolymer transport system component